MLWLVAIQSYSWEFLPLKEMNLKHILFPVLAAVALTGCSDKDDEPGGGEKPQSGKYQLSGKVEKGPFVRGSAISVQPLNEKMTAIGTVFNGEIKDDAGSFDLGQIELASQFVRIATDGYYFNEVSGDRLQTCRLFSTAAWIIGLTTKKV